MKRKMIIARLTALALTTAFTSSITIQTATTYAYSISVNSNEEASSIESKVNDYKVLGGVKNYIQSDNKITFEMVTGEKVRVSFLDNDVFRIYMDPEGKFQEEPTPNSKDHVTKIIDKQDSGEFFSLYDAFGKGASFKDQSVGNRTWRSGRTGYGLRGKRGNVSDPYCGTSRSR